ncbi:alkaline phosphatase family protein [Flagellimonas sp. HMM57]|uniref:alkaline phosphatase PafA n=1 Tax=unclassified Flagellimonas TaxID=2644544 RepID=UPI0013D2B57E|nr:MULTISPECIES: alkaline phosphatase PafA [unclassified Flagellimonas]UII74891.1 alkaline phosphatase family protein [Flagellimonas sp. HMM57]
MKKYTFLLVLVALSISACMMAQRKKKNAIVEEQPVQIAQSPKLVVGIVVDQMRYDYLTRFWNHYGEGGFKRLVNDGFNCKNHHFNYAPTSTGPGHASVYTGTTPAVHGIIGNDWYDKVRDRSLYCAGDDNYNSVGTTSNAGKMSPNNMLTTTITDQLRLHTQKRGKVIAVAVKDRGAVLPGGHMANAAYWFEGDNKGKWISSSYYMQELPKWVMDFNASGKIEEYKKPWTTLKDIATYLESGSDNNNYESPFEDEVTPVFPHSTPNLLDKNKDFEILKYTPYGNSITADFALEALEKENLGIDAITDFLAISFSSTDYIGHKFGVNSKEIQDTYLRLDLDLERILAALDEKVGKGEYTVFLTADHGAINVPAYLKDQRIPAGYLDFDSNKKRFDEFLMYKYGTTDIVKGMSNSQIFLDKKVIANLDMDLDDVEEEIAGEMLTYDGIEKVYTGYQMWNNAYTSGLPYILQNGWNQKRSGDILYVQPPGFASYMATGSTHGSPMIYDTHVPLLLYGNGIKKGSTAKRTEIPDIAPTIATLLGIAFPNGTTGEPIAEVLD